MQTKTKKVKRNYKLHRFSIFKMLRQFKRYNPGKLRDTLIVCKHLAIEAKYQPYEI